MSRNRHLAGRVLSGAHCATPVGGQAVMEGVMMRNGDVYSLAVRLPDGEIRSGVYPWKRISSRRWLSWPFIRGFPILLETMINGINGLNKSVLMADAAETAHKATLWQLVLGLLMAIAMALGLFVLAPHLLSLLMLFAGFGGDVEGLSFHLWDGLFKCLIFIAYIWLIALIPDIRRVFEYHGAEHKTIHAWETGQPVDAHFAWTRSRLHPRCGTTFLLFVICISIVLQALLVPLFVALWAPSGMLLKHAATLCFKLALIIPISAVAYELIRFAARLPQGPLALFLQWPGLALQRLTTREPDREQLEVALVALAEAVGENPDVDIPDHTHLDEGGA